MDASTTIEVEMTDPANNFYIEKTYTFGEITITFLLIGILGILLWDNLLKIFDKKNDV